MASEEILERLLVPRGGSPRLHYEPVHLSFPATEEGGDPVLVHVILIALVAEERLLVAVPDKAWGRTVAERIMPRGSLQQAIRVEVKVAYMENPEEEVPEERMNLWVGVLEKKTVKKLSLGVVVSPTASVIVETAEGDAVMPLGPALADVAEDHFTFVTAQSASEGVLEQNVEARFKKLEEMLQSLQSTVEKVVPKEGKGEGVTPKNVGASAKPAPRREASDPLPADIAHLDPAVVNSALQAGISRDQLGS